MAKKSKKLETNYISDKNEQSVQNSTVETLAPVETVVEESAQEQVFEIQPEPISPVELSDIPFTTIDVTKNVEIIQSETIVNVEEIKTPQEICKYSGKLGKVTVSSGFLSEYQNFFTWLSRDKYVITDTHEIDGNITFYLRGGELQEVCGNIIPEYDIRISRGQIFLTKK